MALNYHYLLKNLLEASKTSPKQVLYVGRFPGPFLAAAMNWSVRVDMIVPYRLPYFTENAVQEHSKVVGETKFVSNYLDLAKLFREWSGSRFDAVYLEDEFMLPTFQCLSAIERLLKDSARVVCMGPDQFSLETHLRAFNAIESEMKLMSVVQYEGLAKPSLAGSWWYFAPTKRVSFSDEENSGLTLA